MPAGLSKESKTMKTIECKHPDCHETRMLNHKTGVYLTYCEKHQREYWRDHSNAKKPGKNVSKQLPVLTDSIGDNGTTIEREHAKTSRLSDAEKQRMIDESRQRIQAAREAAAAPAPVEVPVSHSGDTLHEELQKHIDDSKETVRRAHATIESAETLVATSQAVRAEHQCANGCNDCFYRDVVELLEKHVPGVREMVGGLKTIRAQQ